MINKSQNHLVIFGGLVIGTIALLLYFEFYVTLYYFLAFVVFITFVPVYACRDSRISRYFGNQVSESVRKIKGASKKLLSKFGFGDTEQSDTFHTTPKEMFRGSGSLLKQRQQENVNQRKYDADMSALSDRPGSPLSQSYGPMSPSQAYRRSPHASPGLGTSFSSRMTIHPQSPLAGSPSSLPKVHRIRDRYSYFVLVKNFLSSWTNFESLFIYIMSVHMFGYSWQSKCMNRLSQKVCGVPLNQSLP